MDDMRTTHEALCDVEAERSRMTPFALDGEGRGRFTVDAEDSGLHLSPVTYTHSDNPAE